MWFTTSNGLNRYDGHSFTTFWHDPDDSTSISSDFAEKVLVDKQGNLWIGTAYGLNLFDYESESFTRYLHDSKDSLSLSENTIRHLFVDSENTLWVGTEYGGLNQFDPKTQTFQHYRHKPGDPHSLSDDNIRLIYEDREGILWVGTGGASPTTRGGLNRFDPETKSFTRFLADPADPHALMENRIWSILEDRKGNFWVGSWGEEGLHQLNQETSQFTRFRYDPENPHRMSTPRLRKPDLSDPGFGTGITNIFEDHSGVCWISAFLGGVDRFDQENGIREHYEADRNDPSSLGLNWIFGKMYEDRQHTLWLPSAGNGIYKVLPGAFHHYQHPAKDYNVQTIVEDRKSGIWVGTNKGLLLLNKTDQSLAELEKFHTTFSQLQNTSIQAMVMDPKGNLWQGTSKGLFKWDGTHAALIRYPSQPENPNTLSNNNISTLIQSKKDEHTLWVVSKDNVVHRYQTTAGRFDRYSVMEKDSMLSALNRQNKKIISIYEDSNGKLWMGTNATAFFVWDPDTDQIEVFLNYFSWTICFHEDRNGRFWVASRLFGLIQFDPETGVILQRFNEKSGLSSARINGILEDESGFLWLSNMDGYITRFDPGTGNTKDFGAKDGLNKNSFLPSSFYKSPTGKFMFGGLNGLTVFNPKDFVPNTFPPETVIREVLINEKPLRILGKKVLDLTYQENDLIFRFDALHFSHSKENKLYSQLEGYDPDWHSVRSSQQGEAKYTNLDPGDYSFKVKAVSSDGVWVEEEAVLNIVINPPWWETLWAYGLFGLSLFLLIYSVYRYQKRRWLLKTSLQIQQEESRRLKELDEFKSRFYTNITHEFRTPLTVIQGLAEQIGENPKWKIGEKVDLIKKNSAQLLQLINQMLDLSKLEAGKLQPSYIQDDVITYLSYLTESFHSLAFSRKINIAFFSGKDSIVMDYDPEKLRQIISNLISNALNFTPEYGKITISATIIQKNNLPNLLEIMVRDTGIGIPAKKLPFIFDRFYQVDNSHIRKGEGTGLGLALVKELTDLMKGRIEVESEPENGTTFRIWLPIHHEAELITSIVPTSPMSYKREVNIKETDTGQPEVNNLPLVLLVEDNSDVTYYLRNCLEDQYQIIEARNGEIGLEKAFEIIPDLVISDVMMPEMDGFELCQILKRDERTNHIPVILLTAKASQSDRLEGLKHGADVYLTKPFQKAELLKRLENLLELRRNIQKNYRHQDLEPDGKGNAFLQKISSIVQENLNDPDFNVISLSRSLGMSRVQVFRKLKALTELSPLPIHSQHPIKKCLSASEKFGIDNFGNRLLRRFQRSRSFFSLIFPAFWLSPK